MKALTITAPLANGEQAFFKVVPLVSLNEFMDAVEMIVSIDCVKDLEQMNILKIA